jgi:hypothetical protein
VKSFPFSPPTAALAAIPFFVAFSISVDAAIIFSQDSGSDYLAWEAEAVENVPGDFQLLTTATTPSTSNFGASQDSGLMTDFPDINNSYSTVDPPDADSTAFYTLRFSSSGTFDLYMRGFIAEKDSANSAVDAISGGGGSGSNDSLWVADTLGTGGTYAGTYTRVDSALQNSGLLSTPNIGWSEIGSYTVTAGVDYTLAVSIREDGKFWDRFAAVDTASSLTAADLDGLSNSTVIPEPAPALLLVLGGFLLLAGRRRCR